MDVYGETYNSFSGYYFLAIFPRWFQGKDMKKRKHKKMRSHNPVDEVEWHTKSRRLFL
jgi:hypothetical protein